MFSNNQLQNKQYQIYIIKNYLGKSNYFEKINVYLI